MDAYLKVLKDRQAILDCMSRYCRAVDRLDRDLLLSVYHPDAIDDHGTFCGTPEEFADYVIPLHRRSHISHQHCILNHSCELSGTVAHTETYYMFVCMNREGPIMSMNGGRYIDRLEERAGEWRISRRVCIRDWAQMDMRPAIENQAMFNARFAMLSPQSIAFINSGSRPCRDEGDPSYRRPLEIADQRLIDGRALRAAQTVAP